MSYAGRKINYRPDETFIKKYYEKRKQYRELEEELEEMTNIIKKDLINRQMIYSRAGDYTITLNTCYKPIGDFYTIVKDNGLENYLKVGCTPTNFTILCEELNLDKEKYQEYWYHRLTVKEKKK